MSIHRDLRTGEDLLGSGRPWEKDASLKEAAAYLQDRVGEFPPIAVILGSGLGSWVRDLEAEHTIPYAEIPRFPTPSVHGHSGSLVISSLGGRRVAIFSGRVHLYEGGPPNQVAFPVFTVAAAGTRFLITTNAAGGLNPTLRVGDFLLVRDHVGMVPRQWTAPLGSQARSEPVWGYDRRMSDHLAETALGLGIRMLDGVLFWFSGPTYETPAESRMVQRLGGDAMTMSTLPENIAAWSAGMRSAAISLITNHVSPDQPEHTRHSSVVEVAEQAGERLHRLLDEALATWDKGVE